MLNFADHDTVYQDENGDYVTDLAYYTSFDAVAQQQQQNLQEEVTGGHMTFDDNDFISGGMLAYCLANLFSIPPSQVYLCHIHLFILAVFRESVTS